MPISLSPEQKEAVQYLLQFESILNRFPPEWVALLQASQSPEINTYKDLCKFSEARSWYSVIRRRLGILCDLGRHCCKFLKSKGLPLTTELDLHLALYIRGKRLGKIVLKSENAFLLTIGKHISQSVALRINGLQLTTSVRSLLLTKDKRACTSEDYQNPAYLSIAIKNFYKSEGYGSGLIRLEIEYTVKS